MATPDSFERKLKDNAIRYSKAELARLKKTQQTMKPYVKMGIADPSFYKNKVKEGKGAVSAIKKQSTSKGDSARTVAAKTSAANLNKSTPSAAKKSAVSKILDKVKGNSGRGGGGLGRGGGVGILRFGGGGTASKVK
jgi:hypothetical protein